MDYTTNPHLMQQERLHEARKLHSESEWRLSFLRTVEAALPPQPAEEEILTCYQQRNPYSIHHSN